MPTISIPLAECLLCDARRVEEGDTVLIHLSPDVFSSEVITEFSPVSGVVEEVRASEPPESVDAAMTIEVQVASEDLPEGVETLTTDQIASVECLDCCKNLQERVATLEEAGTLNTSTGGNGAADAGKALLFGASGELNGTSEIVTSSTGSTREIALVNTNGGDLYIEGRQFGPSRTFQIMLPSFFSGNHGIAFPNTSGTVVLGGGTGITDAAAFRLALGLSSISILAENNFIILYPGVTTLTGGGATRLDGQATTATAVGTKRAVYVSDKLYIYELVSGTDAENSPFIIRPDDYNGTSNTKVWKLRPPYMHAGYIDGTTYGGFGTSDEDKLLIFEPDGSINVTTQIHVVDSTDATTPLKIFNDSGLPRIQRVYGSNEYSLDFPASLAADWTIGLPLTNVGYVAATSRSDGQVPSGEIYVEQSNGSASAGDLGEFVQTLVAAGSAVSLTTATAADIASISLTAGDWDVEGWVNFAATGGTTTGRVASISATSATHPIDGSQIHQGYQTTTLTETTSVSLPRKRISLAATTTIYLVATGTFSAGSMAGFGGINARRCR